MPLSWLATTERKRKSGVKAAVEVDTRFVRTGRNKGSLVNVTREPDHHGKSLPIQDPGLVIDVWSESLNRRWTRSSGRSVETRCAPRAPSCESSLRFADWLSRKQREQIHPEQQCVALPVEGWGEGT